MTPKLYLARYDDPTFAGGVSPVEIMAAPSNLGIRWSLPFGLQRVEFTIRANSEYGAYDRYEHHLGHLIAVYDSYVDRPLVCQVYEIVPNGRDVTYICAGMGKRLNDDTYMESDLPTTGNTDVIIEDILTDATTVVSTDYSNIEASSLSYAGWVPREVSGTPAGDAIAELALMGENGGEQMDFYLVDRPFFRMQLQLPLAYFKKRSTTAAIDWQFKKKNITAGGLTLSRNIWNLRRNVGVAWQRLAGSDDTSAGANTLTDSTATFITDGVRIGDRVLNVSDGEWYTTTDVTQTVLTFEETTGNWDNGDRYHIQLKQAQWPATPSASSETDLFSTYYYEYQPFMTEAQAGKYEDWLLDAYEKPVQQQSFVLGSKTIQSGTGVPWPLWRPIWGDSFYFRITDLFPNANTFGSSYDRLNTFMAVAMDYTYTDNRLRIVPATEDDRLDMLLAQLAHKQRRIGQIISTAGAGWRDGEHLKRIGY